VEISPDHEWLDSIVITEIRANFLAIFKSRRKTGQTISNQKVPRRIFKGLSNLIFCDERRVKYGAVNIISAA
jgi:hypothetical protein